MALKACCQLRQKKEKMALVAEFLSIVAEPNRLNILRLLRRQELSVSDIWQFLDLPQSLISHHLRIMRDFGLLSATKHGKQVLYTLNASKLKDCKALMAKFI